MYIFLVWLHSITRWIVLLGGVAALSSVYSGLLSKRAYSGIDRGTGIFFTAAFGFQVIVGLILYFISPWGLQALFALRYGGGQPRTADLLRDLPHHHDARGARGGAAWLLEGQTRRE